MNAPTIEYDPVAEHNELDGSGKAVFDGINDAPDPRRYCHVMASLDYRIPELANPYFIDMFDRCRRAGDRTALNIIDLEASYGVNAALLKWDLTVEQLFGRYTDSDSRLVGTMELLNKDGAFFQHSASQRELHVTGCDISEPALNYALQAGIIDDAVSANLEEREPTAAEAAKFSQADGNEQDEQTARADYLIKRNQRTDPCLCSAGLQHPALDRTERSARPIQIADSGIRPRNR